MRGKRLPYPCKYSVSGLCNSAGKKYRVYGFTEFDVDHCYAVKKDIDDMDRCPIKAGYVQEVTE